MEMAALPVNVVELPLWSPCANGCVMCVRAAGSDVPCLARISNQTIPPAVGRDNATYPESIHFPSRANPSSQER